MKLYLVRHGAYALDTFTDRGPALSSYGREQARSVGCHLADQNANLTHIITSGYLRAQETAALIQDVLCTQLEPIELMDFSPSGDPYTMKSILESLEGEEILVVGHMSSIAYLARALCAHAPTAFDTCTMVILEGTPHQWSLKAVFHAP